MDIPEELTPHEREKHLTVKIPNHASHVADRPEPRADSSQFAGRRGKPRCDHCRAGNLKCDRAQPSCDQCLSAGSKCKYTPLPTPAHRGIPRCDRCRVKNIKQCDRNLPICNHCALADETDCNYSPKKRPKNAMVDTYGTQFVSLHFTPNVSPQTMGGDHCFYGHNVASSSSPASHTVTVQHHSSLPPWKAPPPVIAPVIRSPHYQAWTDSSFVPLPDSIIRHLSSVNATHLPDRAAYEKELGRFLDDLIPQLRQTAVFSADFYGKVANTLANRDLSPLNPLVRDWAMCHRARSGATKAHIILLPSEDCFDLPKNTQDSLAAQCCSRYDSGEGNKEPPPPGIVESAAGMPNPCPEAAFNRVLVLDQIYDALAFVHLGSLSKRHNRPHRMLARARDLHIAGLTLPMAIIFARLCPSCDDA
ncbi:hypothetical protein BDV98DRAFT_567112 [Pterulicium gracile]|uniref:Zn(2)-C6 fungal-type domain-containing protein n=1 Tax=Pterulicium gracile TaxID=1884261 RepID=A0A5C3QT27_9AGAR|nr:hypothetical protein BDV98DRAFT_567112 [Pterula gracilis]